MASKLRACLLFLAAFAFGQVVTTAQATQHTVTLTWTASPTANAITNVWRISGACPTGTPPTVLPAFATVATGITTYVDSTVALGQYCYYLTAQLASAQSVPSNTTSPTVLPFAPTGTAASSPVPGTIVVTWIDALNGTTGVAYTVSRATGLCSGTPVFALLASGLATKTYSDTTATPGTYCYEVNAVIGGFTSVASPLASGQDSPSPDTGLNAVVY